MENKMLTLQQLADITWKSVRTLRRVVKTNDLIKTDYKNTKLVASLDDVLKHYWLTKPNSYPKDNQSINLNSQQSHKHPQSDSQIVNHQANQEFVQSINSLVKQISEVSKENTELQKSLVIKEQNFWSKLINLEHKYQKENLSLERKHDQLTILEREKRTKQNLLAHFTIYALLIVVITLTMVSLDLEFFVIGKNS